MYDAGDRHYYIDELACLKNVNFIIPVRWLEDNNGNVFADAYAVTFDDQVRYFPLTIVVKPGWQALQFVANVVDSNPILVKTSDLQDNFLDLMDLSLLPTWNSELCASSTS